MPYVNEIVFEGVIYKKGDKYRVTKMDSYGGYSAGYETEIGSIIDDKELGIIKIYGKDGAYYNPIYCIELINPSIIVARPSGFQIYSCFAEMINEKAFFSYTDEQFEQVLQIGSSMFKRTTNAEIKGCMKEWILACKPHLLPRFAQFVVGQSRITGNNPIDKFFT